MSCRVEWQQWRLRARLVIVRVLASVLAFALTVCMHKPASAWGAEGHRVIAKAAEKRLTAKARAEIERLLALEPGPPLVSISPWADEVRPPPTAHWHYVN